MNRQDRRTVKSGSIRVPGTGPFLVGLLCLLVLSSCTPPEQGALPQSLLRPHALIASPPDVSDAKLTTASVSSIRRSGIFIQIPAGLPNELASHLLARFQEASIAEHLPLTRTGTIPELTIKGIARAGTARNGTAVALVWEVLGPDGKRVKLLNGEALIRRPASTALNPNDPYLNDPYLNDPWAAVDEATLEEIADAAAKELATWYTNRWLGVPPGADPGMPPARLAPNAAPPAPPPPNADPTDLPHHNAPIDFTTPSIIQQLPQNAGASSRPPPPATAGTATRDATLTSTGDTFQAALAPPTPAPSPPGAQSTRMFFDVALGPSPGDGQLSLAAAVQEALIQAEPPAPGPGNAYRVIGTIALDPSAAGKAHVRIEWTVFTKDGTALGTINQSNEVEAASVAGPWGEVATWAGTAAAAGILELIGMPAPNA